MQKKFLCSILWQIFYTYFHQIEDVEFVYDRHGQTFLSTLYKKSLSRAMYENETEFLQLRFYVYYTFEFERISICRKRSASLDSVEASPCHEPRNFAFSSRRWNTSHYIMTLWKLEQVERSSFTAGGNFWSPRFPRRVSLVVFRSKTKVRQRSRANREDDQFYSERQFKTHIVIAIVRNSVLLAIFLHSWRF